MPQALFRFYAELNDFLPSSRQGTSFRHAFDGFPAVKDVIESLGVPHTEVDLILADGESVDFGCPLRDGVHVSVYPVFESFDIATLSRVRPAPLRELRFVLDGHLSRLARYLRMAGFDAECPRNASDEELALASVKRQRVLLTRDRGLLKRKQVTRGYWIRELQAKAQLAEVVSRFDLGRAMVPFQRCLVCNHPLEPLSREEAARRAPPRVIACQSAFRSCAACGRVYWPGSHHRHMQQILSEVFGHSKGGGPHS